MDTVSVSQEHKIVGWLMQSLNTQAPDGQSITVKGSVSERYTILAFQESSNQFLVISLPGLANKLFAYRCKYNQLNAAKHMLAELAAQSEVNDAIEPNTLHKISSKLDIYRNSSLSKFSAMIFGSIKFLAPKLADKININHQKYELLSVHLLDSEQVIQYQKVGHNQYLKQIFSSPKHHILSSGSANNIKSMISSHSTPSPQKKVARVDDKLAAKRPYLSPCRVSKIQALFKQQIEQHETTFKQQRQAERLKPTILPKHPMADEPRFRLLDKPIHHVIVEVLFSTGVLILLLMLIGYTFGIHLPDTSVTSNALGVSGIVMLVSVYTDILLNSV